MAKKILNTDAKIKSLLEETFKARIDATAADAMSRAPAGIVGLTARKTIETLQAGAHSAMDGCMPAAIQNFQAIIKKAAFMLDDADKEKIKTKMGAAFYKSHGVRISEDIVEEVKKLFDENIDKQFKKLTGDLKLYSVEALFTGIEHLKMSEIPGRLFNSSKQIQTEILNVSSAINSALEISDPGILDQAIDRAIEKKNAEEARKKEAERQRQREESSYRPSPSGSSSYGYYGGKGSYGGK